MKKEGKKAREILPDEFQTVHKFFKMRSRRNHAKLRIPVACTAGETAVKLSQNSSMGKMLSGIRHRKCANFRQDKMAESRDVMM